VGNKKKFWEEKSMLGVEPLTSFPEPVVPYISIRIPEHAKADVLEASAKFFL